MSQRSGHDSRSRPELDLRRAHSSSNTQGGRTATIADELLSDGSQSQQERPPSPGLPLHRDSGMSNLELHDTAAGVSSRRRGNGGFGNAAATGDYSSFSQEENDFNEKDYLLDRSDGRGIPVASTSKNTLFSTKEKEKWSKLIPEDVLGGTSSSRTRSRGGRQQRSGFGGVVSCYTYSAAKLSRARH